MAEITIIIIVATAAGYDIIIIIIIIVVVSMQTEKLSLLYPVSNTHNVLMESDCVSTLLH